MAMLQLGNLAKIEFIVDMTSHYTRPNNIVSLSIHCPRQIVIMAVIIIIDQRLLHLL